MAAHLGGRTKESIVAFERAERLNEDLYAKSIGQMANTWIVNDTKQDYRADEQEYVMLNVFQAFNFVSQGNNEEALVEARRMDLKLKSIGPRYKNPFAYFLSGLLWQISGEKNALEDALIDYGKAIEIYEKPPKILVDLMAEARSGEQRRRDSGKARLYIVEYTGLAPVKVSDSLLIPLDRNHLTKISFPSYQDRFSEVVFSRTRVSRGGVAYVEDTQVVCDLGLLAKRILEGRKASIIAKAGIRPLLKYGVEKVMESQVRQKSGDLAAGLFGVVGSIYNLATEEADLRTWAILPGQIRLVYFDLDPGVYDVVMEDLAEDHSVAERRSFQAVPLKPGEVKFIISRSNM